MTTGTGRILESALRGNFSSSEIDRKPSVAIEQPFDRDGVRWYPVFIKVGTEVVSFEMLLPNQGKDVIHYHIIKEKEFILLGTHIDIQRILCLPFKEEKLFESFSKFREFVLQFWVSLEININKFEVLEVNKEMLPTRVLFALKLHKEPEVQEAIKKTSYGRVSARPKEYESGAYVIVYATKQALYMLIEEIPLNILQKNYAESFFSSFKVLSNPE